MSVTKDDLIKITDYLWEIPKTYRSDMRVPARIFASQTLLAEVFSDRTLTQLINMTTLPGIQKAAYVMPDAHEGYGFPIGAVAATMWPDGVISPGGIGYDINCGVRLLKSQVSFDALKPHTERLTDHLYRQIPSGVGRGGRVKLDIHRLDEVLKNGVHYLLKEGFCDEDDLSYIESTGCLDNADPNVVSDHAKNRGRDQLGTMGAGNHFVEIARVDEIFDQDCAQSFGLFPNQIVVLIHTGSRGLGHQIATDYVQVMLKVMPKYKITLPDRELACVPLSSKEGTAYFNAMAAAANFAWCNRQLITWEVRKTWQKVLGQSGGQLSVLYDVAHNIAKIEEHQVEGTRVTVIVHRKGATRAFGPGHPDLGSEFQSTGQPVIIPGSMGTASYILVGTREGIDQSFGSTCHGAGRRLSRREAKKQISGPNLKTKLAKEGIIVQSGSIRDLSEEAPAAYKDIDSVVDVVNLAGIAKKVARLKPLVVIKG